MPVHSHVRARYWKVYRRVFHPKIKTDIASDIFPIMFQNVDTQKYISVLVQMNLEALCILSLPKASSGITTCSVQFSPYLLGSSTVLSAELGVVK